MDPETPRELLRHAIADVQGSIHANDSKSSAGLVVQGLLATAVVTLSAQLGSVYDEATTGAQTLIKIALIATLVLGGLSIACLILAVVPHQPRRSLVKGNFAKRRSVYFPDVKSMEKEKTSNEISQLKERFKNLSTEDDVDDEYLAELLILADIRFSEARWAKWGFRFLGLEVIFVLLFLGTTGAVTGKMLGAAVADRTEAAIRWEVVQGNHRQSFSAFDDAVLIRPSAQIRVQAKSPSGQDFFRLTRQATYGCKGSRGGHLPGQATPTVQNARLFGAKRAALVERVSPAELSCSDGRPPRWVTWHFNAAMRSDDGPLASGSLRLHAPGGSG
jgi:hypothetical protein